MIIKKTKQNCVPYIFIIILSSHYLITMALLLLLSHFSRVRLCVTP